MKALDMDTRKTLANARVEQGIQDELDDLKRYRRLWKSLSGLSTAFSITVIFLWYTVISWGFEGYGDSASVDKGDTVFGMCLGLVILTIIAAVCTFGTMVEWFDSNDRIRKVERRLRDHYLYMDTE
ncbi:hypothetical protein PP304_gp201 [Gordonia phage Phendrix]|uniref:Uncharacterized protein n=1 Tax=Gordonia phage Phendrix TaxID=2593335 RepID=A0A514U165_9CAUD|nr:hypothetical protein PP304_gp201 [Gordonia phage Phendrix]QDK02669.1 hypothetical protein SEA_PHENDRIX_134 [Gordonia phage Phendrix]